MILLSDEVVFNDDYLLTIVMTHRDEEAISVFPFNRDDWMDNPVRWLYRSVWRPMVVCAGRGFTAVRVARLHRAV